MKVIETERLILRDWNSEDLNDFFEYAKNPNVGPNAGWKEHSSIEESKKILTSFIKSKNVWVIEYKEDKKAIGSLELRQEFLRSGVIGKNIGYVLSEDYWGRGLMTEAVKAVIKYVFEELKIDVLSVQHFRFNYRSKSVIEKCGFKYEGTIRRCKKIFNGDVVDMAYYSILKEEYFSNLKLSV